jgi:anthranilate phosphoribosyltransferase
VPGDTQEFGNYDRKMTENATWPTLLTSLLDGDDLSVSQANWAMSQVMSGKVSDSQLAGFLVALRAKGETVDEIVGFRSAILDSAVPLDIPPMVLDIVGTGGDPYGGVINVSSIASIVAAAAGAPVVKHGNRAASSKSGASDVLAHLGVNLDLSPERVAEVFRQVGLTFVYAAKFHPGFGHAATARKELGIPTVFNILGPLCNPVRPEASAVGVANLARVPQMAGVFRTRGATALLYRGDDGIDKMTTTGHSRVWEVSGGRITEHVVDVVELGLPTATIDDLLGDSPEYNADLARAVLAGDDSPARHIVVLNAAAGLTAFDLAQDPSRSDIPLRKRLVANIAIAQEAIDSGAAATKLDQWRQASAADSSRSA